MNKPTRAEIFAKRLHDDLHPDKPFNKQSDEFKSQAIDNACELFKILHGLEKK